MATSEAGGERPWEYRGAWALAPMVRINTLPFRLLCAEHGADLLYSEELVDKSVAACRRSVSARGEAEYRHADGKLIFSTVPHERVAFQLGTASGPDALAAANVVVDDVCAVDVNMGCPVRFSTQGGMGSSLLTQPERVRDILTTLVRNIGGRRAVTCKIRLLEAPPPPPPPPLTRANRPVTPARPAARQTTAATLDLTRMIASCGVDALAVHCRRVPDRPRHWAQWDALTRIRQTLPPSLPLLLNGDVFSLDDARRALDETGADGLMLARGALWNASLFGREERAARARAAARACVGGVLSRDRLVSPPPRPPAPPPPAPARLPRCAGGSARQPSNPRPEAPPATRPAASRPPSEPHRPPRPSGTSPSQSPSPTTSETQSTTLSAQPHRTAPPPPPPPPPLTAADRRPPTTDRRPPSGP